MLPMLGDSDSNIGIPNYVVPLLEKFEFQCWDVSTVHYHCWEIMIPM